MTDLFSDDVLRALQVGKREAALERKQRLRSATWWERVRHFCYRAQYRAMKLRGSFRKAFPPDVSTHSGIEWLAARGRPSKTALLEILRPLKRTSERQGWPRERR
jgi:hypothetical protein